MARPPKKLVELRVKTEPYFKRDNWMYTNIENQCEYCIAENNNEVSIENIWIRECDSRANEDFENMRQKLIDGEDPYPFLDHNREKPFRNHSTIQRSIFAEPLTNYYLSIGEYHHISEYKLGEKPEYSEEYKKQLRVEHENFLQNQDDIGIQFLANFPIILSKKFHSYHAAYKSALVQLDFSKSENDLVSYVQGLKRKFDEDNDAIQSIEEFLNITTNKKLFSDEGLLKHSKTKGLPGTLTDALFIYDCYRMNLTKEYALKEINDYWQKIRNISTDKMVPRTYQRLRKLAIQYIEKGHTSFYMNVAIE